MQNRRGFFATVAGLASIPLFGKAPLDKVPAMLTPGEFVINRKMLGRMELAAILAQPLREPRYLLKDINKVYQNGK